MKVTIVATVVGVLAWSAAASRPPVCDKYGDMVPECVARCVEKTAVENGCGPKDYRCICANYYKIGRKSNKCVVPNCTDKEIRKANKVSRKVCKCVANHPKFF